MTRGGDRADLSVKLSDIPTPGWASGSPLFWRYVARPAWWVGLHAYAVVLSIVLMVVMWATIAGVVAVGLGALYFVVRFVKWAWMQ